MLNLPFLTTWIESLAKTWLQKGVQRVPVDFIPNMGWSKTGTLKTGNTSLTVAMACDLSRQMQIHTVQFDGPNNNIESGSARTIRPQATIRWMVQGVTITRIVDVIDGTAVSGLAQAVDVSVADNTFGGVGTEYRIGIIVAPGVRPNTETPPTLRMDGFLTSAPTSILPPDVVAIPNADTMNWTIPPNVGAVGFMVQAFNATAPLEDDDLFVEVVSVDGTVMSLFGFTGCFKWMPLPATAQTISLRNNSGAALQASAVLSIQG